MKRNHEKDCVIELKARTILAIFIVSILSQVLSLVLVALWQAQKESNPILFGVASTLFIIGNITSLPVVFGVLCGAIGIEESEESGK